jgi:hypothetical protein
MRRTKRAVKRDAHDLLAAIVGFEVVVIWGGELFTHFALNEAEARDWAAQYREVAESIRIWAGNRLFA